MKIFKTLLFVLITSFISVNAVFSEENISHVEEITKPQPIAIGEVFFTKSTPKAGYQARYKHMGFDGDNIVVKYELYYHYDELEEVETFKLITDASKQALLSTKPFTGEDPTKVTKLLIKVVDGFGRIKVREYKGQ